MSPAFEPVFESDPGDEVDSLSDGLLATLRDGEGPSPVVPSPPRRACTSSSTALARCRGRALYGWVGVGVVALVALALLAFVVGCSVVAPTELVAVGEWVEGGGAIVSGRRHVLFVKFLLYVLFPFVYFFCNSVIFSGE